MSSVTLAQATTIVDKALEKGRELKLHPLTVVVLDAGGHMVAMKREDKSGILRTEIAAGKAWGTLGMGFGGREFARRAASGGAVFLQALMAASDGRIVPAQDNGCGCEPIYRPGLIRAVDSTIEPIDKIQGEAICPADMHHLRRRGRVLGDRKSTRLNSSHRSLSRMPSSA